MAKPLRSRASPVPALDSNWSVRWEILAGADLRRLEPLWQALVDPNRGSIFERFELARAWAEVYGSSCELRVWSCESAGIIAPFAVRDSELTLLGDGMFDYPDLIGRPEEAALDELASQLVSWDRWRTLKITGVRADSPFRSFWRRLGAAEEPYSAAPLCDFRAPAELDRRHPKASDRLRALLRRGAEFRRIEGGDRRSALLEWILRRKSDRMVESGVANVLGPLEQQWLRKMTARHPELVELWALSQQGEWMSGFLTWSTEHTRYGYSLSFAPEFARFSPGVLLLYGCLRQTMADGRRMDLLTGEQPFKMRFADRVSPVLRIRAARAVTALPHSPATPMTIAA
jgi:CelD/BcsL family acetyltransferase involved in cellulose biosynthesis